MFISLTEKIHFDELVFELKKKWKPLLMIECIGNILRFKWKLALYLNHHPSYTFTVKGHEAALFVQQYFQYIVVGDIFGLVFWPLGSLSKMASSSKIQTLTKNSHDSNSDKKFSLETRKWETSLEACEDHEGFVGIFDKLKIFVSIIFHQLRVTENLI